jgi:hypothetical protein
VSPRLWCLREQVRQVVGGALAPPATWSSVLRRVVVVAGFFTIGLVTGELPTWAFCCFGALQIGLVDMPLPFRRLAGMLALTVISVTAAVFIAMCLGGTWWCVPFIAALAFVYGVSDRLGGAPAVASLGALALGVILAGHPLPPAEAATASLYVALGMLVQAAAWLALSARERRAMVRRAVALKLRSVASLLRDSDISPAALAAAHAESERMEQTIRGAGLPADQLAAIGRCASDAISASRAVSMWVHLRSPGDAERLSAFLRLRRAASRLNRIPARRLPPSDVLPDLDESRPSTHALLIEFDRVDASVDGVLSGTAGPEVPDPLGVSRPTVDEARTAGLRSVSTLARLRAAPAQHGMRMAVGVGLAEALSVALPLAHSFWLPLTVVFTLKPDWSFTVVRGLTRVLGNLAAVLVLPALMLAFGGDGPVLLVALMLLSTIAFRWFFGSYIWASFGLAGTVLVLDFAQNPDTDLFAARIIATVVGALLSLCVALAMSGRASATGREKARALSESLTEWAADARARVGGADVAAARLESDLMSARRALVDLEPVSSAAVFELRPQCDPVALAMVYASAARFNETLVAVTASSMIGINRMDAADGGLDRSALDLTMVRLDEREVDFTRAMARLGA